MAAPLLSSQVQKSLHDVRGDGIRFANGRAHGKRILGVAAVGIGAVGILWRYFVWRSWARERKKMEDSDLFHVDGELNLFSTSFPKPLPSSSKKSRNGCTTSFSNRPSDGNVGQRGDVNDMERIVPLTSSEAMANRIVPSFAPVHKNEDRLLSFGAQQARAIRRVVEPVKYVWEAEESDSDNSGMSVGSTASQKEIMFCCAKELAKQSKMDLISAMTEWLKEEREGPTKSKKKKKKKVVRKGGRRGVVKTKPNALVNFLDLAAEYLEMVKEKRRLRALLPDDPYQVPLTEMMQRWENDTDENDEYDREVMMEFGGESHNPLGSHFLSSALMSSALPSSFLPDRHTYWDEKGMTADPLLRDALSFGVGKKWMLQGILPKGRDGGVGHWGKSEEGAQDDRDAFHGRKGREGDEMGNGWGFYPQVMGDDLSLKDDPQDFEENAREMRRLNEERNGLLTEGWDNKGFGNHEGKAKQLVSFPSKCQDSSDRWNIVSEGGASTHPAVEMAVLPTLSDDEQTDNDEWMSEAEEVEVEEVEEEEDEEEEKKFVEYILATLNSLAVERKVTPEVVEELEHESRLQKKEAREAYRQSSEPKGQMGESIAESSSPITSTVVAHEEGTTDKMDEAEWEETEGDVDEEVESENSNAKSLDLASRSAKKWWSDLVENSS